MGSKNLVIFTRDSVGRALVDEEIGLDSSVLVPRPVIFFVQMNCYAAKQLSKGSLVDSGYGHPNRVAQLKYSGADGLPCFL